ncbi:TPA: P22 phage major capsid protein family protein, partial [Citrobacter braakii]
ISYFLNPSDYRKAGRDLTAGDIFGRVPEEAYHNGTIQRQVAGFDDVMRSPKLPTVVGSTVTGVTVTGAQKFKPQAFTTDTDGNNENVDIDSAIGQNLGNDTLRRYKQANAIYADEANKLQNTRLKNVIMKGDLTPEVVNNMLFSKNKSEVQNLYRSVGQVGRAQMRNGIIGKAMEKSGGSPDQFLRQVNLMSNQTGIAFKGRDAAYLKGLKSYLEATKRAGQAGVTTPTGQQAVPFVAAAAAIASPKFAAIGGGYGVLARLYESEIGRNAVLRLANTPRGSTTFEKALSDVERVLNSVAQGAKSESLRE